MNTKGYLSSKLPDGVTDNEAAVDKEPIVRVMLVDTVHHKLVDQKYMKVQFKKEEQKPVELGEIATYERNLGCNTLTMNFTWDQITTLVYAKMKDGAGMSKGDFHQIYTDVSWAGAGSNMKMLFNDVSAGSAPLAWEMNVTAVGKIAPALTKDYTVKLTFSDPKGLYGDVTFSFKLTVKAVLPTLNGYYENYWFNGNSNSNIYPVYPIQYQSSMTPGTTCVYFNNMFNAFTFNQNTGLLKGMTTCGAWDMQFAQTGQLAGFAPSYVGSEPNRDNISANGGYSLLKSTTPAAKLTWGNPIHSAWGDNTATIANVSLDKANRGRDLLTKLKYVKAKEVDNFKRVKMGIWSTVNEYNCYEIKKYDAVFVAPLAINAAIEKDEFYDGVVDGSIVPIAGAFKFTDFRGYTVAKVTTGTGDYEKYAAALYKYYEVQDPTWDTANAKIGMKNSGGSSVVDDALTAENSMPLSAAYATASVKIDPATGDLVFTNNNGSNVEQSCNIFIKATVVYGWGTEEEWVKIRLNPSKN